MAYDIVLTNDKGVSMLGSDGHMYIDHRLGLPRICEQVQAYRRSFELNFKHKFDYWTHFIYKGKLYPIY